ncbi:hypothetical protein G6M89_04425 [Natronolimnobius sp. AArcel1]|uniref:hypothetical protein n=1 Tax=Natronolimnobius sp. AArcel1 TaxID=1679093 RepID=UPI0013E9B266|nr:hypothetical protein [Natronolimnobius sp. AArcel1]NGM68261.1 hypothetical protein [Natronolimnobius sp. AArcel1]
MDPDDREDSPRESDRSTVPSEDEVIDELTDVSLTPTEHQRIKDLVNQDLATITSYDRRYLSVGAGGTTGAAARRKLVYDRLDERTDPPAVAFRLEDYGLTPDEIRLWARAFDILCGRATQIVAVIEDFDGGYVWELGLLFAPPYREKVWVLKRAYDDPQTEREKYENGMAASHVELLLSGPRCHEWDDSDKLRASVDEIP